MLQSEPRPGYPLGPERCLQRVARKRSLTVAARIGVQWYDAGESMIIGVDIGGTKGAAGLVDSTGEITHKPRVPMIPAGDAATGFAAVANAVEAIFSLAPQARGAVTGIGETIASTAFA